MINPDDLRQLADFLDEHPVLAGNLNASISAYTWSKAPWQDWLDDLGTFEKVVTDWSLAAERTFGESLKVRIACDREATCVKVQTGTKFVSREVYPESVTPTTETTEEPVYEWVCPTEWKARDTEEVTT